ncbi:Down syndrome cell adhesion molecule-like protein Dscam2 [Oopsacas minuta]|uniref:Down syndrome cell adhesion molecule-like protein Dscam2 n=1 Tax=Oopsacas minuta TaxID=111878 RepID=A0AAV7K111_9METZ|nr:Down syndrome cell adhesion molecule-like protein Dscam2 [Oopsacas minuta]
MYYLLILYTLLLLFSPVRLQNCPQGVSIVLTRPNSVLENGLVDLTCSVTIPGDITLPTEVTWHKDFLILETSDSSRYITSRKVETSTEVSFGLQIQQAQVEDSGLYSCDPVLSGALCRASVNLTVNYALAVIVEDQDALTGTDVTLVCLIRGVDTSVIWYRFNETTGNNQLYDTDGKYSFSQEGSYFYLSFDSASSEDTGVYACEGRSPTGRVQEDFNFYSLLAPSGTIIRGGTDGEFVAFSGDDLILECYADGVRAPEYNWTINGVKLEVDTDDLIFNMTSGELTIVSATKFDEGTYTCEAYNKAGSEATSVVVTIHIVASIIGQDQAVNVGLGSEANLTVRLSASPPIDFVQWTTSSDILANSTKYRIYLNGTLLISDITESDDTAYKLKACNTISGLVKCAQSQPISLLVILPSLAPTDLEVESEDEEARSVEISWINPPTNVRNSPEYYTLEIRTSELEEYTLLDEEIPVTSSSSYTLTKLFFGYQNLFRLRGSNLGGLGEPSNVLNVTLIPGEPRIRSVTATVISSTSLNVTYLLWHDGGSPLTSLFVQYKENSSDVWNNLTQEFEDDVIVYFIVITDLKSATYFDIRVQVSNELGESDFFEPAEKLLPDSLPGVPVLSESNANLDSVEVSIILDDFGTGELLGFFIKYVLKDNETIEEVSVVDLGVSLGKPFVWEITGLENEATYVFSAAGNSTIGLGPYSKEVNIYTDTKFYEDLPFKILVGVAACLVIFVLALFFLLGCIGCCCFKYGKKREYKHIYKTRPGGPAENFALTEDGPDGIDFPQLSSAKPLTRPPLGDGSWSERSTPPVVPPRKGDYLDEVHSYHPSPPLAGYTAVKDPKRALLGVDYPSDPFGDLPMKKNFMGQDKPPNPSLGNISQGSYITDV